jgi:hypothetical protein
LQASARGTLRWLAWLRALASLQRRRFAAALALYLAALLLISWPLLPCLATHQPLGTLRGPTVPWFNLWTLEWNADRFAHGLAGYWDAPIFHPAHAAFAFSEPQALTAVPFALLQPIAGSVAAYNLTLLLLLLLNALAMRRLLRLAGSGDEAATCGGLFALALPFVWKELGVLQLTALAPSLLALAEIALAFRVPTAAGVVRLALCCCAALWTCVYHALFLSLLLLLAGAFLLARARTRRRLGLRAWRAWLAALLLLLACGAPLVIVQRAALAQLSRDPGAIRHGSASAMAYLRFPPGSASARVLPELAGSATKRSLYPGMLLFALACAGFAAERRGPRRMFVRYCVAALALSLLVSFGTRLSLFGSEPYALTVQRWLPGFAQLRSPYRMGAFVQLLVVVLASFGLQHVLRWARRRWTSPAPLLPRMLAPLLVALALFEIVPWGVQLRRFPHAALDEPWIAWLAQHPGGAVAMVPPEKSGRVADFEPIVLAMLQGLRHGHPLVNGYSGFFPTRASRISTQLAHFPRAGGLRMLQRAGVRYAVVDDAWLARQPQYPQQLARLRRVFTCPQRSVFALE